MHELQRIHDAVARVLESGRRGLLVTVVASHGSTYRKAGTRSVIGDDSSVTGAISGGCVERDLILRVQAGRKALHGHLSRENYRPCVERRPSSAAGLPASRAGNLLPLAETFSWKPLACLAIRRKDQAINPIVRCGRCTEGAPLCSTDFVSQNPP
jgi:xanthine/CO dehydrogenase XdhC/CoxF family maturation factor